MTKHALIPIATAVAAAMLATGSAAARSAASVPDTPVGAQLAWTLGELNGRSSSLGEAETRRHLSKRFRVALPPARFAQLARQATSAYAPVSLVGFAGRPTTTSAIALLGTRSGGRIALYVSVDPRPPHRVAALDITTAPARGPATLATDPRYTGMFEVGGGRTLFLTCSGSGSPTVVLEAGAGGGAHSWFAVQPWLATKTRVCSYDRANLPGGRSDPAPKPRAAADVVADLHGLLHAARVPGPYVLVGHSNGGLFARLYATTHPEQVQGLVLIDTGNYPAMLSRVYKRLLPHRAWLAYRGSLDRKAPFAADPADEQIDLTASYRELAAAQHRHPLRAMPLVVISHGVPDPSMGIEPVPGLNDALERQWQRMQVQLATLVPRGRRLVATRSDHMIPTGQPGLVVRTVEAVLAQIAPTGDDHGGAGQRMGARS